MTQWFIACGDGVPFILHKDNIAYNYSRDGTHTDSPSAPMKPHALRTSAESYAIVPRTNAPDLLVYPYDFETRVECATVTKKRDTNGLPRLTHAEVDLASFKLPPPADNRHSYPKRRSLLKNVSH